MKPDTLYKLSELLEQIGQLLSHEAHDMAEKVATQNRLHTISDAVDFAERLIAIDGLDRDAAAAAAAHQHGLPIATVRQNIAAKDKASIRSRMAIAEQKRRTGASVRSVSKAFNIPKSTIHDRRPKI